MWTTVKKVIYLFIYFYTGPILIAVFMTEMVIQFKQGQARAQKFAWLPSISIQFKTINARWFVSNAKWFVSPLKTNNKEKDEQLELFE